MRVAIRCSRADRLNALCRCLPPGWSPAPAEGAQLTFSVHTADRSSPAPRLHEAWAGGRPIDRSPDFGALLDALERRLGLAVAEAAQPWLFVHAGVVEWKGRAIVLPGRSFSGKTTLVAALVRQGARYYSDEYAVFDAAGRVHPFPRALRVRTPDGGAIRVAAAALGGRTGRRPLRIGLLLVTRYRPGATWRPRRLSAGQGVLALFAHTVAARSRPAEALNVLQRAVTAAPVMRGAHDEAGDLARLLLARDRRFGSGYPRSSEHASQNTHRPC